MRSFVSFAILFLSFSLFSSFLIAQTSSEKSAQGKVTAEISQSERKAPSSLSEEDETVLREDIVRMRAILDQMVNNLAFVDTTQSPLKHQFQLEIDMWNTAINDMERRLRPHTR
jgi:uncharacterized membrane protein